MNPASSHPMNQENHKSKQRDKEQKEKHPIPDGEILPFLERTRTSPRRFKRRQNLSPLRFL
jgi:hypothetical protein